MWDHGEQVVLSRKRMLTLAARQLRSVSFASDASLSSISSSPRLLKRSATAKFQHWEALNAALTDIVHFLVDRDDANAIDCKQFVPDRCVIVTSVRFA